MNEANSIFRAAIPEPYRILGLKLKPFSLGHYLTLQRFDCAFVADAQANATREDVIFACLVCSMTFDEFNGWIDAPQMTRFEKLKEVLRFCVCRSSLKELGAALDGFRPLLDVVRWGRMCGMFDVTEKAELFLRYLKENSQEPKFWFEKQSEETGSHWAHNVIVTLTSIGFTHDQVYNMPLREALMHFYKHAENLGIVRLMTSDEIKSIEDSEKEAAHGS